MPGAIIDQEAARAPTRWRKKPVEVDAFQFGVNTPAPGWFMARIADKTVIINESAIGVATIKTFEGTKTVLTGDYILQGTVGELYSYNPGIFLATYEPVS